MFRSTSEYSGRTWNLYLILQICSVNGINPELLWKVPDMLPHKEFVFAYGNGSLGCSVSVLLTLRLFFAGRIRQKTISISLLFWAVGFLLLIAATVVEFLKLPFMWALLCTAITLAFYVSAFFYSFGAVVLSTALAKEDFYRIATAERALWIYSDDEKNLPKTHPRQF
jgi:hypothetical protein